LEQRGEVRLHRRAAFPFCARPALALAFLLAGIGILRAQSGWGLNSRLNWSPTDRTQAELADLRAGRLLYLREDLTTADVWPQHEPLFRQLARAGYKILGVVPYGVGIPRADASPVPAPDLRDVYREAEALARRTDHVVSVWELYNEPDTGFCSELPDRFAAESKAAYLGLKAASRRPVLLPSLGLPPGPWLERAVANGLLDYGDAFNLHYYGHASDFADFLDLSRTFLRDHLASGEQLPLWITEIGIKTDAAAPDAAWRLQRQTRYLRDTMRTAANAPDVAAFLPYSFRDANYSLADGGYGPYPALALYLRESRTQRLRDDPAWLDQAARASRVILQWAAGACVPDKVSGAYEFIDHDLRGTVRLYNFSTRAMTGTLELTGLTRIQAQIAGWRPGRTITIPPLGRIDLPVRFSLATPGYLRETAGFLWHDAATRGESPLSFGLATAPPESDFVSHPIAAHRPDAGPGGFQWIDAPAPYSVTDASGPWLGLNGLTVQVLTNIELTRSPSLTALFYLFTYFDRDEPTMAVAKVDGFPSSDFLRLRFSRPPGEGFTVRVDLIDNRGERYTVFENGGSSGARPSREIRLHWRDFNLYFWGRYPGRQHPLDPRSVREIQLRFHFDHANDPVQIDFDALQARTLASPISPRPHADSAATPP
jgi:hypothetical protein